MGDGDIKHLYLYTTSLHTFTRSRGDLPNQVACECDSQTSWGRGSRDEGVLDGVRV